MITGAVLTHQIQSTRKVGRGETIDTTGPRVAPHPPPHTPLPAGPCALPLQAWTSPHTL